MSYQPKGKVKVLLDAMDKAPGQPIWSQEEAALVMEIPRNEVPQYLATALHNQAMFRRVVDGKLQISRKPFPVPAPAENFRIPKFGEQWEPPKMVVPREGSDSPKTSLTLVDVAPAPLIAAAPAPEPEPEPVEFDAVLWAKTGDIVVYGAAETEDGGVLFTPKQQELLRSVMWRRHPG